MHLKKIALSLFVIAASGVYVWLQSGKLPTSDVLGLALPRDVQAATNRGKNERPVRAEETLTMQAVPFRTQVSTRYRGAGEFVRGASFSTAEPTAKLQARILPSQLTVAAGGYVDGAYTGPAVDAYYGLIQVKAIVQGGRLVGVKVLQYPSDRRTSISINRRALPMLRDEVISAQSVDVDIISGATLTSEAFLRSLATALRQATA
jgi:uncharacterized protein with FMN-binding domain